MLAWSHAPEYSGIFLERTREEQCGVRRQCSVYTQHCVVNWIDWNVSYMRNVLVSHIRNMFIIYDTCLLYTKPDAEHKICFVYAKHVYYIRNMFRIYETTAFYNTKYFAYTKHVYHIRNKFRIYDTVYPSSMGDIHLLCGGWWCWNGLMMKEMVSWVPINDGPALQGHCKVRVVG